MPLTRVKKVPTANLVQGSSFLTSVTANELPAGSVLQMLIQGEIILPLI